MRWQVDDLSGQPVGDQLTQRELDILRLVADGLSNQEIAARLFISLSTVKWYLKQIYSKLHVGSRTQAISAARTLSLFASKSGDVEYVAPLHNLPHQPT